MTLTNLDMGKGEHKSAEYLKIHPMGQLPALTDGPFSLFESGALLLYLGETFGALDSPQKRAKAAQWILFAQTTLSDALFKEEVGRGPEGGHRMPWGYRPGGRTNIGLTTNMLRMHAYTPDRHI